MDKNLKEEIVNDLLNNFKSITGYNFTEIIDFNGEHNFFPDLILKTFKELDLYCAKKYQIDLQQEEELLQKLDDKILIKAYNERGNLIDKLA